MFDKSDLNWKLTQADAIVGALNDGGEIQMYATDGYGVRPVNSLLSEDQIQKVEEMVKGFLSDTVHDLYEVIENEK